MYRKKEKKFTKTPSRPQTHNGKTQKELRKGGEDVYGSVLTFSFSFFLGSLLYFAIERSCSKSKETC